MNLNKTKIRIKDKEHSILVQNALRSRGFKWISHSWKKLDILYDNMDYIFIDGYMEYSGYEFGKQHPYKEITLEDILACEIQYEIY
jgi:hypothetical protein